MTGAEEVSESLRWGADDRLVGVLGGRGADRFRALFDAFPEAVGVPPEIAARVFGIFARGARDRNGAGIGLAVCRRSVEAHGGRIWVEPADGGGSAFRFSLPRS